LAILSYAGTPVVFEEHEGRWNVLVRRVIAASPLLVVISEGLRSAFVRHGVLTKKIAVAHDGVDLEAFAHPETKIDARTRLGLPLDAKIALYIGRLDGWKGVDTLYAAAELLPEGMIVAIIGGEERDLSNLRLRYSRVRFIGPRPYRELADNQAAADVLVLPNTAKNRTSAEYTSPLKLFTYMASGRPIVASDLSSIREVLDDESAYFAHADDPKDFARAIQEAFHDEKRALRAREAVHAYTWHARAEHILTHPALTAFVTVGSHPTASVARVVRYGLSGILALTTNVGLLFVCVRWLGFGYLMGTTIAFIGTVIVSFLLQKFWTFDDRSSDGVHYQLSWYLLLSFLNIFVNALLMYSFVGILHINYLLAQILSSGTIAVYGFFVYRVIFSRTTKR
jgi:putative flippase GtrA